MRSISYLIRPWFPLAAALLLASCGGGGGGGQDGGAPGAVTPLPQTTINSTLPRIEPYDLLLPGSFASLRSASAAIAEGGTQVRLGPLTAAEWAGVAVDEAFPGGQPRARQIGLNRPVSPLSAADDLHALLQWRVLPGGGQAATLRVRSDGAAALRLGLAVEGLPPTAVLRIFPAGGGEPLEFTGAELMVDGAGPRNGPRTLWWSPSVRGDEVALEFVLRAGQEPSALRVTVPQVSHLWVDPGEKGSPLRAKAGTCNVDASCQPGAQDDARSVARMAFVDGSASYLCTGTLMADVQASGTPYLLSANHCVSNQAAARTLETWWFYQSTACDSGAVDRLRMQRVIGGATLLHASTATDVSFMSLRGTLPVGVRFAGSLLAVPPVGALVSGLHHPSGEPLKYSEGQVYGYKTCTGDARSGSVRCSTGDSFIEVRWNRGTTELGSSGSALFGTIESRRYVTGQLYAGRASCADYNSGAITQEDYYGRLDISYRSKLHEWLGSVPGAGCPTAGCAP